MDFPSQPGSGHIFMDGNVHSVTWAPLSPGDYITKVTFADGSHIEVTDYEERFDFIYSPSDDGQTFYHAFVLLEPDETDPVGVPTATELRATAQADMAPIITQVIAGEIDADDMVFCRNLFTIPECLLRRFQKHGSVSAARRDILKDLWSLS